MIVKDEPMRKALLGALADEYSLKIMSSTTMKAKSVTEIVNECNIPISTAYRRINEMKDSGLLVVQKIVLTDDGKKFELFRSTFRNIAVRFQQGAIEVEATPNEDIVDRTYRLFQAMRIPK